MISGHLTERAVTVCVINYNGERHLGRSLGAVRRSELKFEEVLLVDNDSTDASLELVQQCYPEVRVLRLPCNEGPGSARNAGFFSARHDLILFLDNDVALGQSCAGELRRALGQQPGALLAMPRVLYAERPEIIQYDGADCHFLGHMIPRNAGAPLRAAQSSIEAVSSVVTACFLIDRTVWGGTAPFDPSFIFNYEDHDFGVRSRVMGHRLLVVPSAICLHGSGTPGLSFRPGAEQAPLRIYCLIRNRWRIILRSYALRTLVVLGPVLVLYELFQLAGALRKGWLRIWLRAAGWMLAHPRDTAAVRRVVQRARRTADREILRDADLPVTPELRRGITAGLAYAGYNRLARAYWRLMEARL